MNLISQIEEIKNKISGKIYFDESLSKYSWFNLGGPAKVIFKPKNLNELSIFLKNIKGFDKIKVLGVGSNTLIRDGGFNGIIIKLGKSFSHLSLFDQFLNYPAGFFYKLTDLNLQHMSQLDHV